MNWDFHGAKVNPIILIAEISTMLRDMLIRTGQDQAATVPCLQCEE